MPPVAENKASSSASNCSCNLRASLSPKTSASKNSDVPNIFLSPLYFCANLCNLGIFVSALAASCCASVEDTPADKSLCACDNDTSTSCSANAPPTCDICILCVKL